MKTSVEELKGWIRKISVEEDAGVIKNKVEEKLKEYAKKISLPGFRPGRVPVSLVRKKYGPAIENEVIEEVVNELYRKSLKENDIEPIHQYPIEPQDFEYDTEKGLKFSFKVEVEPQIDVKDYKGHGITPKNVVVTDKKVEEEIEFKLRTIAEYKEVDREAKEGDYVVVDYEAISEENKDPREDVRIRIAKNEDGKFDAFVEALIGKKKGDEYTVDYTYPEDFQYKEIAGKTVTFKVKVKKVEEEVLPELNDEVAKKLGYEDVEQMKVMIKESIADREKQRAKNEAVEKIIEYILEKNQFDVPNSMVERTIDRMLESSGLKNDSNARNQFRERAEYEVKKYLVLDAIAKKEGIKAKSEDVDNYINDLAQIYGKDPKELKDIFRKNGTILDIREELKINKTIDFLLENAKNVEADNHKEEDKASNEESNEE